MTFVFIDTVLRHGERGREEHRVTERWSISNKWRDGERVKDTGRKETDGEIGHRRARENGGNVKSGDKK